MAPVGHQRLVFLLHRFAPAAKTVFRAHVAHSQPLFDSGLLCAATGQQAVGLSSAQSVSQQDGVFDIFNAHHAAHPQRISVHIRGVQHDAPGFIRQSTKAHGGIGGVVLHAHDGVDGRIASGGSIPEHPAGLVQPGGTHFPGSDDGVHRLLPPAFQMLSRTAAT